MTLEQDVMEIAHRFGVDAALIQAVVTSEGNILKAVQCSLPSVKTRAEAIEVTCRSAAHAMSDWIKADPERLKAYVEFWGSRWAPVGASNDPKNLNRNWISNVTKLWA